MRPCAQTTTASQACGTEEEKIELLTPGSFDLWDRGSGVAREAGAGTVDSFDAVGMLGNPWRWTQDGADKDTLRFELVSF